MEPLLFRIEPPCLGLRIWGAPIVANVQLRYHTKRLAEQDWVWKMLLQNAWQPNCC